MKTLFQKQKTYSVLGLALLLLTPQLGFAGTGDGQVNPFVNQVANTASASSSTDAAVARANELSHAFRSASAKVLPALVAIETSLSSAEVPNRGRPNPFVGPGSSQPEVGIGSGVIVDPSGVILTNNHVVMSGKGKVTVRLNDGREFQAAEVLTDPVSDIAVIRIQGAGKLVATPMGNSETAEVGDWVLALGQPFGLESTVTAGIISAKQRGIGMSERESYIQTDAAINPGNSGGPLVNLNGEVIGINTAISSRSGGNEGIGFAIPINLARWVGGQLIDNGMVKRSYIGVGIQELTASLAKRFDVQPRSGVLVTLVQPNSPGADAGLKTGDILVSFDNHFIRDPAQLQLAVERCEPGQKKVVIIVRDGKQMQLMIIPDQLSNQVTANTEIERDASDLGPPSSELGMRVEDLRPEIADKLGVSVSAGVLVTAIAEGGRFLVLKSAT